MKFLLAILFSLLCGEAFAEQMTKVVQPVEVKKEFFTSSVTPKEFDGLQWNRWTSQNFVVCALNDGQAQYLNRHLELVKSWVFVRWGIPDINFSIPCKIIGVDDPNLFKKLFGIDSTRVEVRRDSNGKIKETVIFLLMSDKPSETVPMPLTQVCLAEFSQKFGVKVPPWIERGMSQLNGTIAQIRLQIADIKPFIERNDPLYFSKGLFETDSVSYAKLDVAKKKLFDDCSMIACLMIRKEFGQDAYLKTMKGLSEGGLESVLQSVLMFKGYDDFDRNLKRFYTDITRDVASGKTPDHYLQIKEK
jgi:hypothetical protein